MRDTESRVLVRAALFSLTAFGTVAVAEDREGWIPDGSMVNHVEALLREMPLPTLRAVKADSFDSYGRYYTGETGAGHHKEIVASFILWTQNGGHLGCTSGSPTQMVAGGGCKNLTVVYDIAEDRIKQFVCYGLG